MKALTRHEFEQMWQANGYSMLASDLGVPMSFDVKLDRISSFTDKNWFLHYENSMGSMYYSKQEMKLAEYWGRRDFLDRAWFSSYISRSRESYEKASRLFEEYTLERLEKLDEDQLYVVVREVGFALSDVYAFFNASQPQCVLGLEKDLTVEISKGVPDEEVREVLLDLTRSAKLTLLEDEAIDWFRIGIKSLKGKELDMALRAHVKKYGVLGTADGGEFYGIDYYRELYLKYDAREAQAELEKKLSGDKEIKQRRSELIAQYKLTGEALKLADIIAQKLFH